MRIRALRGVVTCAILGISSVYGGIAAADTVTAKLTGVDYAPPYTTVQLTLANSSNPTINNTQVIAGPEHWHQTGGTLNIGDTNGDFTTYCIEIMQDVVINSTYNFTVAAIKDAPTPGTLVVPNPGPNLPGPMGQGKADMIGKLWALHHSDTLANDAANLFDKAAGAAAFQTAIWEIVYEDSGTLNLATGDLIATATAGSTTSSRSISIASSWLSELSNNVSYTAPNLKALSSSGYQDQIFELPVPQGGPGTPLPSAACAGLALLGLLGASSRGRRPR